MKTIAALAAVIGLVVVASASASPPPLPPSYPTVTTYPDVARDLTLAVEYWTAEAPQLVTPPCIGGVQVTVGPMAAATTDDAILVPASEVWAETPLSGCTITLSPQAWTDFVDGPRQRTAVWDLVHGHWRQKSVRDPDMAAYNCYVIAHEYGHVLGLGDSTTPLLMDSPTPVRYADPICDEIYGRWTLTRAERFWLRAAGLLPAPGR